MNGNAVPPERGSGVQPAHPAPTEPGGGSHSDRSSPWPQESAESRADLVLLLGILSLFLCFPLGIAAWLMGNSDLQKMRAGRMRRSKERTLRLGRNLGAFGTIVFAVCVVLALYVLPFRIKEALRFPSAKPLAAGQYVFAGRWVGNKGTIIKIHPNGRADYRTGGSSVRGGVVQIGKDSLSIGLFGISKTWHIDKRPYEHDGLWMMKLNGEVFTRESDGLLVVQLERNRTTAEPALSLRTRRRIS